MNHSMKGKRKIEITFEAFDRLVEWGILVPDELFHIFEQNSEIGNFWLVVQVELQGGNFWQSVLFADVQPCLQIAGGWQLAG